MGLGLRALVFVSVFVGVFGFASRHARALGVRKSMRSLVHRPYTYTYMHTKAYSGPVEGVEDESASSPNASNLQRWAKTLYKFSRPHTIKGTILASTMAVVRAMREHPSSFSFTLLPRALLGLVALLLGNAYIVGINQIYDKEIDKINKPFLPIAAGELSKRLAWPLVLVSAITGLLLCVKLFPGIIVYLYVLGLFLGTVYSVPPLQLKRFPVLAGVIIATVRGFLLNFGVYYAVRDALQVPFSVSPIVVFIASLMTVFASVIAVTKDLPDVEGDTKYNVQTFASKFGVKRTAAGAASILSMGFVTAMALPFIVKGPWRIVPMVTGHGFLLTYFLWQYSKLETSSMASIKRFYRAIWNTFYMEYILYPFI